MPYVSQITVAAGSTYEVGASPGRTLLGIAVPAMSIEGSSLAFVNAADDEVGYALTEDAQTVLSPLSGSAPHKKHLLKAFGEPITIELLQEWAESEDDDL